MRKSAAATTIFVLALACVALVPSNVLAQPEADAGVPDAAVTTDAAVAPTPNGGSGLQAMEMDDEQARRHFLAGRSLYDAGRFALAAAEFEEAYRLSNRTELLYNMYVAYRDATNLEKAVEALRTYLEEMPEVEDRGNLEARLESMQQALAEQRANAEAARAAAAAAAEEGTDEGPPPPAPEPVRDPSIVPWIVVAAGGALVIGGAAIGLVTIGAINQVDEECPNDVCQDPTFDLDAERSQAQNLALVTDVLFIAGGVTLATGFVMAALGIPEGPIAEEQPPVSASCGLDGCMATYRGAF